MDIKAYRRRIHEILDVAPDGDVVSRICDAAIIGLIVLNVLAVIMETVDALSARYENLFASFETFSVIVFTVEYLMRLWSCTAVPRYEGMLKGRIRYAFTPLAIVDVLAILPFYLPNSK